MTPRAALLSPSIKSYYSIATVEKLTALGVEVPLVVVRRMVTPSRIRDELRRDGTRLLKKAFSKLVLREPATPGVPSIREELTEAALKEDHLLRTCRRLGIAIRLVSDLNDPEAVDAVARSGAQGVVFTGGGLIRQPLLRATPRGVLNCHMGILPRYRGMDVVEWAILEDRWDHVGLTVHLMDDGIDTGPILRKVRVDPTGLKNFTDLRKKLHAAMPSTVATAATEYLSGQLRAQPQQVKDGKQYFIMHPSLQRVSRAKLEASGPRSPP
ncbi:MAG: hypothetical protein EA397_18810 [Deltaproteobacteria bacterium]|nr:MAG: hypothetical protein EA397_18810 [Deltaproteobacteria bacterium]